MKSISEWQKEVHHLSIAKGWHDQKRNALEFHALIMSELGEATNEARKPLPAFYQIKKKSDDDNWSNDLKPEGELVELADAVIRILDYCESKNWNLEEAMNAKHLFNKTRPFRHGGKLY